MAERSDTKELDPDLRPLFTAVEAELRAEKERIADEIRGYPPPIPACDAQFNYLIERRDRVSQELGQLHAIVRGESMTEGQDVLLRHFLVASTCLGKQTREALLASL